MSLAWFETLCFVLMALCVLTERALQRRELARRISQRRAGIES